MTKRARTEVLPTHTPALFRAAVARAAELLQAGELVALPTETVYGLAANALNARAARAIFRAKGRPAHNPIIVHVSSVAMARRCVRHWPTMADRLARAFWPGPLTLVLPKADAIPPVVTAGGDTVGVRWPAHPFIQAVIRKCGFPLAAPSANRSTRVSPTQARHVLAALGGRIPLIVDGGPCAIGLESTVFDLTSRPPRVLRPGMIHEESRQATLGNRRMRNAERGTPEGQGRRQKAEGRGRKTEGGSPVATLVARPSALPTRHSSLATRHSSLARRSPGLLPRHYSPRARLVVLDWANDAELGAKLARLKATLRDTEIIAHSRVPSSKRFARVSVLPHQPAAFARALYAQLHRCDQAGARLIVVEAPPDHPAWRAIVDRLQRAAGTQRGQG